MRLKSKSWKMKKKLFFKLTRQWTLEFKQTRLVLMVFRTIESGVTDAAYNEVFNRTQK